MSELASESSNTAPAPRDEAAGFAGTEERGDRPSDEVPIEAEIVEEQPQPPVVVPPGDYTEAGVPTFDYVRDRIETRIGATELAKDSPAEQSVEAQLAERDRAGREKLEEIRRAMRGE